MNLMLAVAVTAAMMKGPFPILSMPYHEDGSIDYEALHKEACYVADSGCPGMIWGQSNDEVDLLKIQEKFACFEACAKAAEGRAITLALGANGTNVSEMVEIAAEIERVAVRHPNARIAVVSRPSDDARTQEDLERGWEALARVVKRPVIMQTFGSPETPTPSVDLLAKLAVRHPDIYGYVKEEASGFAAVSRMQEENQRRPPFKTLFAGWGGWQVLMQMRQCGCEGLVTERSQYAPVIGKIWRDFNRFGKGLELVEDIAMFRLLTDQRNFPGDMRGYHLYFFVKAGIFKNMLSRDYVNRRDYPEMSGYGVGKEWKLVDTVLNDLQKAELDLLYEDMLKFSRK